MVNSNLQKFIIEYELPPLRAIYRAEVVAPNSDVAQELLLEQKPRVVVRSVISTSTP